METTLADGGLLDRVQAQESWYHTIELGSGVETPGWYDLRPVVDKLPIPGDLRGQRCLDIATFDGFWAFTLEARGADEVVAIDILDPAEWDWPHVRSEQAVRNMAERKHLGEGFLLAREALGSSVDRRELSVYDLSPDEVGTFDFVYLGSLLLHLKDPVRALEAARSVCTGTMVLLDAVHLPNTIRSPRQPLASLDGRERPWWWRPNRAGLIRMVEAAGFELTSRPRFVLMPPGKGQTRPSLKRTLASMRHAERRTIAFRTWVGEPHLALSARPA